MSKKFRITKKHRRLRHNGVIYTHTDEIPEEVISEYLEGKDWIEEIEESETDPEADPEGLVTNKKGGWYKVVGLEDAIRGKKEAIEKAKEILAEGGE